MADVTTTYDVNVRYIGHDNMSRPGQQVVTTLDNISRSSANVSLGLGRIGTMLAGAFGLAAGKRALIDFNSGLEQNRITMAGLWQQYKGGDFTENLSLASDMMKKLQLDARASVGTTKDFVNMASMLAGPIAMAGGNMENLRAMTKASVVGARAFSMDWQVAARDVDQALRGTYRAVDPFTSKLLTPLGFGGEAGRTKFNAMSAAQRFATLQKAMSSSALLDMAKAQETSFDGVVSTLQDTIMMTLGKVGIPLFQRITQEVKRWNDWLDKNQALVDRVAADLGGKLVTAAEAFAKAVGFAAEHWKTILGVWATAKSMGALTSIGGMLGQGAATAVAGSAASGVAGALGGAGAGGLAGLGTRAGLGLGLLGLASGVALVVTSMTVEHMEAKQAAGLEMSAAYGVGVKGGTLDAFIDSYEKYNKAKNDVERKDAAKLVMAFGKNQKIQDADSLASAAEHWSSEQRTRFGKLIGIRSDDMTFRGMRASFGMTSADDLKEAIDNSKLVNLLKEWTHEEDMSLGRWGWNPSKGGNEMPGYPGFIASKELPKPDKPTNNIIIHRIEVVSDDPDRFVFNLERAAADTIRNPSASRFQRKFREG